MRTFPTFAAFIALAIALASCGQTGPLYLPPTCSPHAPDGSVVPTRDEDGEVLPPCPPPEPGDELLPEEEMENDGESTNMEQDQ